MPRDTHPKIYVRLTSAVGGEGNYGFDRKCSASSSKLQLCFQQNPIAVMRHPSRKN